MILGSLCTRNCAFCNVRNGLPLPVDDEEASRVAEAALKLGLRYVVLTSVTRDDLADGGASHFARVIRELKERISGVAVEALVPDFLGDYAALRAVILAGPDVLNHNVETVPRLYPSVRPAAVYERSLGLLRAAKNSAGEAGLAVKTKSGLMLGLGETPDELYAVFRDLAASGCDFLTLGQYLAPSPSHEPVREYVTPKRFEEYRRTALEFGFSGVAAGPFVRSSYRAAEMAGR
jgi:lipoic acid synthetase